MSSRSAQSEEQWVGNVVVVVVGLVYVAEMVVVWKNYLCIYEYETEMVASAREEIHVEVAVGRRVCNLRNENVWQSQVSQYDNNSNNVDTGSMFNLRSSHEVWKYSLVTEINLTGMSSLQGRLQCGGSLVTVEIETVMYIKDVVTGWRGRSDTGTYCTSVMNVISRSDGALRSDGEVLYSQTVGAARGSDG
jgi:hypothetical protein